MSDLRVGIIGSGYMARTFAECLRKYCRGGRLVAVAGGTRAPITAAEFGAEAFAAELQDFLDSVREGRPPFATGRDGRAAVELVEAANRSSETGAVVPLPL
jgi:predicted dehydrogenase